MLTQYVINSGIKENLVQAISPDHRDSWCHINKEVEGAWLQSLSSKLKMQDE